MVKLSAEQERLSSLISETVTLLCRNGLKFKSELKVQGLLGISLDDEVFLVQIEKRFEEMVSDTVVADVQEMEQSSGGESEREPHRKHRRVKQKTINPPILLDSTEIKCEPVNDVDDELVLLETDAKINLNDKSSANDSYKNSNCQGFNTTYLSDMNVTTNNMSLTDQKSTVWGDDPLSALTSTSQDNSRTSGNDNMANVNDMLDPQPMSSLASTYRLGPIPQASTGPCHILPREQLYGKGQRQGHERWKSVWKKEHRWERGRYVCPVPDCQRVFSFSTSMYRHKRVVHNIHGKPRSPRSSNNNKILNRQMLDVQNKDDLIASQQITWHGNSLNEWAETKQLQAQ